MKIQSRLQPIEITAKNRSDMDLQLERAVQHLMDEAQQITDHGILVTRHSDRRFTVEVHPSVPFGLTKEQERC